MLSPSVIYIVHDMCIVVIELEPHVVVPTYWSLSENRNMRLQLTGQWDGTAMCDSHLMIIIDITEDNKIYVPTVFHSVVKNWLPLKIQAGEIQITFICKIMLQDSWRGNAMEEVSSRNPNCLTHRWEDD